MHLSLDPIAIAEPAARLARTHDVRSALHVGIETGVLGAVMRFALDHSYGRTAPDRWSVRLTGLVASNQTVPFGSFYDAIEAESVEAWLKNSDTSVDLILAPRLLLNNTREKAARLLRLLYERTAKLLLTVAPNDLSGAHFPELENRYTVQLLSADFPRVRFTELGPLTLAAIFNEFLPL